MMADKVIHIVGDDVWKLIQTYVGLRNTSIKALIKFSVEDYGNRDWRVPHGTGDGNSRDMLRYIRERTFYRNKLKYDTAECARLYKAAFGHRREELREQLCGLVESATRLNSRFTFS